MVKFVGFGDKILLRIELKTCYYCSGDLQSTTIIS